MAQEDQVPDQGEVEKSSSKAEPPAKSHEKSHNKRQEKNVLPSKVAIRHLPPSMSRETFVEEVSPLPDYDYLSFVAGDPSLGQYAFSRAYVNFCNQEDVFIFTEKFDGYVFVDSKGDEYCAIVEFAPFQKVPRKVARKKDGKSGTIEADPDFLKFLELREKRAESETPPVSTTEALEEITAKERELKANKGVVKASTPLLDFLRKKKEESVRAREEKKEARKRKEVERRKGREHDDKKKNAKPEHKRHNNEKPPKLAKNLKLLVSAKPGEEEDELTKNLKSALRIAEDKDEAAAVVVEGEAKKAGGHREGKFEPREFRKKDFGKKERRGPGDKSEVAKGDASEEKSAASKTKTGGQKETKSYKEERHKMQEARAARAAAKLEGQKADGCSEGKGQEGKSSNDSKPNSRLRNKDRPALQIYRPGMLKSRDPKLDSAGEGGPEEAPKKGRTFVSTKRKKSAPAAPEPPSD